MKFPSLPKILALFMSFVLTISACAPAAAPSPAQAPASPRQPQQPAPAAAPQAPAASAAPAPTAAPAPAAKETPRAGGRLRTFQNTDPPHLDGMLLRSVTLGERIQGTVYEKLIRYKTGPDVELGSIILEPNLAESWETPNDTTYIFHLRKGVKWHNIPPVNGREFVADDVVWSYERNAKLPGSVNAAYFSPVSKVEAVDKYTVKVTTKQPFAPFLILMAYPFSFIGPKEIANADGDLKKTSIGTGPFVLTKRTPNVVYKLDRNPNYHMPGVPYLDGVDVFTIPDTSAQLAALRAAQIDLLPTDFKEDADSIAKVRPDIQKTRFLGLGHCNFHFRTDEPPWNNEKLRQAFSVALNRQAEIDTLYSGEGEFLGVLPPSMVGWAIKVKDFPPEIAKLWQRDVKYAKQLLTEAGYPNGGDFPFTLRVASGFTERVIRYEADLREAGIRLNMKQTPNAEYLATAYIGKYSGAAAGCGGAAAPDPGEGLMDIFHPLATVTNRGHVNDPVLTKMLDEQRQTLDLNKRIKLIRDIQLYLAPKQYYVFMSVGYTYSLQSPRVRGFNDTVAFNKGDTYRYVWLTQP